MKLGILFLVVIAILIGCILAITFVIGKVILADFIEGDNEPEKTGFTFGDSEFDEIHIEDERYYDQRKRIDSITGPDKNDLQWSKLRVDINYDVGNGNEFVSHRVEENDQNLTSIGESDVLVLYIDKQGDINTIDEGDVLRILIPQDIERWNLTFYHDGEEIHYVSYHMEDA